MWEKSWSPGKLNYPERRNDDSIFKRMTNSHLECFIVFLLFTSGRENRRKFASFFFFFPHTLWIVHEELLDELLYDYHHGRSNVIHFYGFHVVRTRVNGKKVRWVTDFSINDETRQKSNKKKMTKNVALSNYYDCYLIDVKLSLLAILSLGASVLTRAPDPAKSRKMSTNWDFPNIRISTWRRHILLLSTSGNVKMSSPIFPPASFLLDLLFSFELLLVEAIYRPSIEKRGKNSTGDWP